MYITGHDKSNYKAQEEYQYSGEIISFCFNEVLKTLIQLARHYVFLPQAPFTVHSKIVLLGDSFLHTSTTALVLLTEHIFIAKYPL